VGGAKDKVRIEQLLQQVDLDKSRLEKILERHKLKLPKLRKPKCDKDWPANRFRKRSEKWRY